MAIHYRSVGKASNLTKKTPLPSGRESKNISCFLNISRISESSKAFTSLMEEVKIRFDCINMAATGKTGLPSPIAREFCYLQIRFLCELISLACLVAHGDIAEAQSHKLGRSWSAEEIINRMAQLRPSFFPLPVLETIETTFRGKPRYHTFVNMKPSLTREQFLGLYADTHKYLHRGSLKRLLSSKTPLDPVFDIPEIIAKAQLLSGLLRHHFIATGGNKIIICMLNNCDNNNSVQVVIVGKGVVKTR